MQWALLCVLGAATGLGMRRILLWRRCGVLVAAKRLYLLLSWVLGGGCYAAMLTQEAVLLFSGQLTWRNALPLHLCSAMGLLTLPMLLSRRRMLWHFSLYLGLPGALMALLFPAIQPTPWPQLTALAFHTMHCCVLLSPLLPMCMGMRPAPRGAAWSLGLLLLLGLIALGVNAVTGGNYLFLNASPLPWMAQWRLSSWRLFLILAAAGVVGAEAGIVYFLAKKEGWFL